MLGWMKLDRCASMLFLTAAACGPESSTATAGGDDGSSTHTTAADSTTADVTATSTTSTSSTVDSNATTDATSSPTESSTSDTSGMPGCEQPRWPECAVASCLEVWDYECSACDPESSPGATCFGQSEGCAYPFGDCGLPPSPCGRVWGIGESSIDSFEDEAAATCMLEALRDGVPGTYSLLWGEMGDFAHVEMQIHLGEGGGAQMQWYMECQGCIAFGTVGRSAILELQPPSYFDDCLAAPTTESLAQCIFGFTTFEFEAPPPEGYTPPFTTGRCSSLEPGCPT